MQTIEIFTNYISQFSLIESTQVDDCMYGFMVKLPSDKVFLVGASASETYVITTDSQTLIIYPGEANSTEHRLKYTPSHQQQQQNLPQAQIQKLVVTNLSQAIKYNKYLAHENFFPYATPKSKYPISTPFTYETRVFLKRGTPTRMMDCTFSKSTGTYVAFEDDQGKLHKIGVVQLNSIIPNMNKGKVLVYATYQLDFANCSIIPTWVPNWDISRSSRSGLDLQIESDQDVDSESDLDSDSESE